jgi:hypothetical protein
VKNEETFLYLDFLYGDRVNQVEPNNQISNQEKQYSFPEDIATINLKGAVYQKMYHMNLVFSLKTKRFIRPIFSKRFTMFFKLAEAKYVFLSSSGKVGENPMLWRVKIVLVRRNKYGLGETSMLDQTEWLTAWEQEKRTVPILKDIPTLQFHRYPDLDFKKQYSQVELTQLLKGGIDPVVADLLLKKDKKKEEDEEEEEEEEEDEEEE